MFVVVACLLVGASLSGGAADARARFLEGDFAAAVAAADAVQKEFEGGPAWTVDDDAWTAWADSRITRALALRRLGREEEAERELRALAVARPAWTPDTSYVPPKVVARFNELREELLATKTVPLTVEIKGGGGAAAAADVVLDGRAVPVGVLDVLPGLHFIGVAGKGQKLDVRAPTDVLLEAPPVASNNPPIKDPPPPTTTEEGPPWLIIGIGAGAAAVVAVVAGVAALALSQPPPIANPGGTTLNVDSSRLDPDND